MPKGPDDPSTDESQPELPECRTCGIDKEQARRLKNFAKQVLLAKRDTMGTVMAARLAIEGDLKLGFPELVGHARLGDFLTANMPGEDGAAAESHKPGGR